jgi:transposase-like protein
MTKQKRKFTPEERMSIIQECEREGVVPTARKYNLSPGLIYKWKERLASKGINGLKDSYKRVDPDVRRLEEENERLKRIITKQALELEVKGELLKKTPIQSKKG